MDSQEGGEYGSGQGIDGDGGSHWQGTGLVESEGHSPGRKQGSPSWEQLGQMGPFEGMRRLDLWELGSGHLGGWGDTVVSPWGRGRPNRGARVS